ncbi:MAG: hypothetical protein ACE5IO_06785 [Thermoplasmata archaeon]
MMFQMLPRTIAILLFMRSSGSAPAGGCGTAILRSFSFRSFSTCMTDVCRSLEEAHLSFFDSSPESVGVSWTPMRNWRDQLSVAERLRHPLVCVKAKAKPSNASVTEKWV